MVRPHNFWATLAAAILLVPAIGQARTPNAAATLTEAQSRLDQLSVQLGWQTSLRVQGVAAGDERSGRRVDDNLLLSEPLLATAGEPRELTTLLIFLAEDHRAANSSEDPRRQRRTDPGPILAALAVAAAATALDPPDRTDPSQRYKPSLGKPHQLATPAAADEQEAARLLADVERAGSCSGPFVDVLRKLARADALPLPVRNRAARTLKGLGSGAYPPDYFCVG
ncbi:hypothetical protein AWL63_18410 [Sphingomonas panacis]|uniref:Uncharacterized protein n=1 Tax=Sphingomonas panacis TaxID=1560345 RepID=A0A1B3ZDX8_9SPHN|nr:hypothetical protein [Sphingomonas panacis]AOH85615.1 hypothetical protein AWL63_18410 [Sphingomonas panacis]